VIFQFLLKVTFWILP